MPDHYTAKPAPLLREYAYVLLEKALPGPVLDLACGEGRNGLYVAERGLKVICCDRSKRALSLARQEAERRGLAVDFWQKDLEKEGTAPLPEDRFGAILVFRYLHRPLLPSIRAGIKNGGFLFYETFTIDQPIFGKPCNPLFLLKPGELKASFQDWRVIHYFEGVKKSPRRAVAQIVCQKC